MKISHYLTVSVIIKIVAILAAPVVGNYFMSRVLTPTPDFTFVSASSQFWPFVGNLGLGYWLFKESKSYVWAVFGIIFSLPAIILFYILKQLQKK